MIQFVARKGMPWWVAAVLGSTHVFVAGAVLAQENSESAVREYRRLAEQGDVNAQAQLGYLYYTGEGVTQNYTEAVKWYQKAAVQGNRDSQYNLAVAYAFGEGIRQDYKEAVLWYRRAAEQGHTAAQYSLGISYSYGEGVPLDPKEAAKWFRAAAEQGYVRAQVMLGSKYHTGDGVQQDFNEAVRWYRMAADRGDAAAQYNLGSMYRSGKGVQQDYNQAMRWYRLAADQGYAAAQNELASLERAVSGAARARTATETDRPAPVPPPTAQAAATPTPAPKPEAATTAQREPLFSVERSELLTIESDTPPAQPAQPAAEPTAQATAGTAVAPTPEMHTAAISEPAQVDAAEPVSESAPEEATPVDESAPKRGVLGFLGRLFKPGAKKSQEPADVPAEASEPAAVDSPADTSEEMPVDDTAQVASGETSTAPSYEPSASETELLAMEDLEPALPDTPAQEATGALSDETDAVADAAAVAGDESTAAGEDAATPPADGDLEDAQEKQGGVRGFFGRLFSGKKKHDVPGEAVETEPPPGADGGDVAEAPAAEPTLAEIPEVPVDSPVAETTDSVAPDRQAEIEAALEAVAETGPETPAPPQAEVLEAIDEEMSDVASGTETRADITQVQVQPAEGDATAQEPAPEEQRGFFSRLFGRKPALDNQDAAEKPEAVQAESEPVATTVAEPADTASSEGAAVETVETGADIEDQPVTEGTASTGEEQPRKGIFQRLFGKPDQPTEAEGDAAEQAANAEPVAMAEPAPEDEVFLPGPTGRADPAAAGAALQALQQGEYGQAFSAFSELSAQGDAFAQFQLGSLYYQGLGVAQDYESAALWYRRAAEQGNANAQYSLGNMFLMGEGVGQDDGKAAFWYQKASEAGHASARHNLENLQRLKEDPVVKAGEIAEGEAEPPSESPGGEEAQTPAGSDAEDKRGFFGRLFGRKSDDEAKQDTAEAEPVSVDAPVEGADAAQETEMEPAGQEVQIEQPGAEAGGDAAGGEAGTDTTGEQGGIKKFFGRLFGGKKEPADTEGDAPAPAEETEAAAETDAAAATDDATAPVKSAGAADEAYQKGIAYSLGDGAPLDTAEAFKWFMTAAELGHAPAQYKIGAAYAYGEGTDEDPQQAAHWYSKAAAQGYAIAQRNLGIMYMNGDGVDQNKPLALAWYTILADGGNVMDMRRRDLLVQDLSESELAEARQIMDQLRAGMSAAR